MALTRACQSAPARAVKFAIRCESSTWCSPCTQANGEGENDPMGSANLRLLLLASALLATAACSTGGEAPGLSPRSAERHRTAMTTRVSLSLPLESSET